MSGQVEIITGHVRGPHLMDDGDIVVVAEDAVLTGRYSEMYLDAFSGVLNRAGEETNGKVIVEGKILLPFTDETSEIDNLSIGVNLYNAHETSDASLPDQTGFDVIIEPTGLIHAYRGIQFLGAGGNLVDNKGQIQALWTAIVSYADNTAVTNSGFISAFSAFAAIGVDGNSVFNTGTIRTTVGVDAHHMTNFSVVNEGCFRSEWTTFQGSGLSDVTIQNNGEMSSMDGGIVAVYNTSDVRIENTGLMSGETLFYLGGTDFTVENTGMMRGDTLFNLREGGVLDITNRGDMIARAVVVEAQYGHVQLDNSGLIRGNVMSRGHEAHLIVENSGHIQGSVVGGLYDDTYLGSGRGQVSGFIAGGSGDDELTGGRLHDDLRGGDGADRLEGGAGRDVLTGGRDRDTLVFGPDFGRDVITDFRDDVDTLELSEAIWGGGKSVEQVLQDYGRVIGTGVVLDFGDGNRITLEGFGDIHALADDIILI